MNYYIGDTHFGHSNVIHFDNRPFQNRDEMDQTLIDNWNARVKPCDDVWIIGDFCYKSGKVPENYLKKLNGKKHLVLGNHDKHMLQRPGIKDYFESIEQIAEIEDGDHLLVLSHFPLASWNKAAYGSLHIYAHIHNNLGAVYEFMSSQENAYNAGCMINN